MRTGTKGYGLPAIDCFGNETHSLTELIRMARRGEIRGRVAGLERQRIAARVAENECGHGEYDWTGHLKPIRGRNTFCGPAALATITGLTTDEIARRVRILTGRRSIKGMYDPEMVRIASHCGLRLKSFHQWSRAKLPTLSQWLRVTQPQDGVWIIRATSHFFVIRVEFGQITEWIDNHSNRPVTEARYIGGGPRSRVLQAWLVRTP